MKLESKKCSIGELLRDGAHYVVPVYQRSYEWSDTIVETFINNIIESYHADRSEPYFIGTMQFSDGNEIIDGQQRITILLILLKELKLLFPENKRLKNMKFDMLETHVNNKIEQEYLSQYFLSEDPNSIENDQNKYAEVAYQIREEDCLEGWFGEDDFQVESESFIDYILDNVVFIVVLIEETSLPKTIKIATSLKTLGRDLNYQNIFKLRLYEYFKSKGEGEEVFDKINKVYERIKKENLNFKEILNVYHLVLIAKYKLPSSLFDESNEDFFTDLLDTLLRKRRVKKFLKVKKENIEFLKDIETIIDSLLFWKSVSYPSSEDSFTDNFIFKTRYSSYNKSKGMSLVFPYLFFHKEDSQGVFSILREMNKLFFLYTVYFDKPVTEIDTLMKKILRNIERSSSDTLKNLSDQKNNNKDIEEEPLKKRLGGNIVTIRGNKKLKDPICIMAEYLKLKDEGASSEDVYKLLFDTEFDIDPIHANEDGLPIWKDKELQNSIGNLAILERYINKSIKDKPFLEKKKSYKESKYPTIQEFSKFPKDAWEEEDAKKRRDEEIEKIIAYIYS